MGIEFDAPQKPFYVKGYSVELRNNFPPTPVMIPDPENPFKDAAGNPTPDEFTIYTAERPAPTEENPEATQKVEIGRTRNTPNMIQATRTLADGTTIPKLNYGSANVRVMICDKNGRVFHTINRDQQALSDDTVMGLVALGEAQMGEWLADLGDDVAGVWQG